ncbi:MAG TPA: hypothetical protein VMF05_03415 [Stellaceae bacterium]|nr:hypothetical protein [Stellaceae bacterium]
MRKSMSWQKSMSWLWIVGCFGLAAAANAQTPPAPAASAAFDGTYTLLSATRVTPTYRTRGGQMFQCPELTAGPLTVAQGQASYTTATGHRLTGTVGPQGQLSMRSVAPPSSGGGYRPVETEVTGNISASGYARIRQIGNSCSYDFLWQREAK